MLCISHHFLHTEPDCLHCGISPTVKLPALPASLWNFFLNKLPVLQLLKPHLSCYHFWWKFTNLLQKRALEGSQIQLFAFFFSRMTPVAPQLTEFGLLTETSDDWKLSQGRQPSQLQQCLKHFLHSLWGQMAKTKLCFCKTWSSTILHESLQ